MKRAPSRAGLLLDKSNYVMRHCNMTTNVRTFLREFSAFKAQARKGSTVRIRDREGEFLFASIGARRTLLGAARGKIAFREDLTQPSLPDDKWKPSL